MHERVRAFSNEGIIKDDANFAKHKDQMRILLEDRMREEGVIPDLDKGLHWSTVYVQSERHYKFKITMFGVFVGREKANGGAVVYYDGRVHEI